MKSKGRQEFTQVWRGSLGDYIRAITWCPKGLWLGASSAGGEVVLMRTPDFQPTSLQSTTGQSIDCLAFSPGGQFLAVAGQQGQLKIWSLQSQVPQLVTTLENPGIWVDCLCWNPVTQELAFSLGKYVQVWDAKTQAVVTTLNFADSTVLGLDWRGDGKYLAVAGYQGVKVWNTQDWETEEELLAVPSATVAISWSPNHQFLAQGNLDSTLSVSEWSNPHPWLMRGFPSKVRHLAWSEALNPLGVPVLASSSGAVVVIWERSREEHIGWESWALENHLGLVQAIAFQPQSLLLASAAEDGEIALWQGGKRLKQLLKGAAQGFSCLAWHPQGNQLAAGGRGGELLIWAETLRGKGFA